MVLRLLKGWLPAATALWLVACGGGSTAPEPSVLPVETTVDITPALGGVSAGVLVTLFNAQTGAQLAQGLTQQVPLGTARLTLRDFQGAVVIKVEGAPGATYYDERSGTAVPFPASKVLLSVAPDIGGGSAASLGVTPLTHALSAMVGVTTDRFSGANFTPPSTAITSAAVNAQVDLLLANFGLTRTALDLFAKPIVFGIDMVGRPAGELKLAGSGNALAYGALLTALARSIPLGSDLVDSASLMGSRAAGGTLASSGYLDHFGSKFQEVLTNNLGSGVPVSFRPVITGKGGAGSGGGAGSSSGSTSGNTSGSAPGTTSLDGAFPVGLSVGSPTELGNDSSSPQSAQPGQRGWLSHLWQGDTVRAFVAQALGLWLPNAHAQSAAASREKLRLYQDQRAVDDLLSGAITLGQALGTHTSDRHRTLLHDFVAGAEGRAHCYGPTISYTEHPDTRSSDGNHHGMLPSGDLGLWTETERGSGDACAAAQMNKILVGPRAQVMTGLKVSAAALVAATLKNGGRLPAVGSTVAVGAELHGQLVYPASHNGSQLSIRRANFTALSSGAYLTSALIGLSSVRNGVDETLEVELRLLHFPALANAGASSARALRRVAQAPAWADLGLLALARISPAWVAEQLAALISSDVQAQTGGTGGTGGSGTAPAGYTGNGYGFPAATSAHTQVYSGLVQMAHRLANNAGSQLTSNGWKLTSVAYQRLDEAMYVKARAGSYAGDPANPNPDLVGNTLLSIAAFQHNGELDPTRSQDQSDNAAHDAAWKWTGGFTRLGAEFNASTFTGAFSSGWVAGIGLEQTRLFNVLMSDTGGTLGGVGFFGFGNPMQGATYSPGSGWASQPYDGLVGSFICNWTSVGQANGPARGEFSDRAQLQIFTLSADQRFWRPILNALAYSPTSTCNDVGLIDTAGSRYRFEQGDSAAGSGLSQQPGVRLNLLQGKRPDDATIKDYIVDILGRPTFARWI